MKGFSFRNRLYRKKSRIRSSVMTSQAHFAGDVRDGDAALRRLGDPVRARHDAGRSLRRGDVLPHPAVGPTPLAPGNSTCHAAT